MQASLTKYQHKAPGHPLVVGRRRLPVGDGDINRDAFICDGEGARDAELMARHIFPNLFSIVTVIAGFSMAGGILAESGLSYLGLGVRPPTPSWGNMLNNSLENVSRAPWLVLGPGLMIGLTVLCIFLVADGLRDALDPRLRR